MKLNLKIKPDAFWLIIYLLYLLILTMRPFDFITSSEIKYELAEDLSISNFLLNVVLFIPFGFLLFSLLKGRVTFNDYNKVIMCSLLGAILSFIIETYQLFFYTRGSEISDVFTNTAGSLIGALLARLYYKSIIGTIKYIWFRIKKPKYLIALVAFYSILVFTLFVFPIKQVDFRNWNPSFTFQIGNEATLDRAWRGKLYLVAIYNRALSGKEVYTNFEAGYYFRNDTRVKDGLITLYNFTEGGGTTVHDNSGFGSPLNLTVYNPSSVRWLSPHGLKIQDNTIIKTQNPAKKLYKAIMSTNEFSVEVWIAPANITQGGPARVVSFSKDTRQRNFTLGQVEKDIHFRVRTPLSGLNGGDMNLRTEDKFLTPEIQHLVTTYRKGVETLFVNGAKHSSLALFDEIKLLDFFGKSMLSKAAFCFFFFFPLSFLSYLLFSNYFRDNIKYSIISTVFFSVGLLVVIESFYVVMFANKVFDFALIFWAAFIGILTPLLCRCIN